MTLHFSHIARYVPSIQSHIHLKSFAQILTIVMKHPLSKFCQALSADDDVDDLVGDYDDLLDSLPFEPLGRGFIFKGQFLDFVLWKVSRYRMVKRALPLKETA